HWRPASSMGSNLRLSSYTFSASGAEASAASMAATSSRADAAVSSTATRPPPWRCRRARSSRSRRCTCSASEVGVVEGLDPLPAVIGGLDAVGRAVHGEERVTGAVIAMKLVGLVLSGEDLVELVHLLRAGVLVIVAEQPQQRAAQVGQLVDQVGHLEREPLLGRA